VILTTQRKIDTWMDAPMSIALQLQRPLADGALMVVARDFVDLRKGRRWSVLRLGDELRKPIARLVRRTA
jgi:hypothetical protein